MFFIFVFWSHVFIVFEVLTIVKMVFFFPEIVSYNSTLGIHVSSCQDKTVNKTDSWPLGARYLVHVQWRREISDSFPV